MNNTKTARHIFAGVVAAVAAVAVAIPQIAMVHAGSAPIRIAARNFTEEQVAGYLYSELLSAHGVNVQTNVGFGTESAIFSALKSGSEDVVPDYLGNGLVDLNQIYKPGTSPYQVWIHVKRAFKKKFHLTLLNPAYKFNDQNVFVTTKKKSKKKHLKTLSDLAKHSHHIRFEVMLECTQRTDCLKGFDKVYHSKSSNFKQFADPSGPTSPDNPPFYDDLLHNKFDVVQGYGRTDAQIAHYHLVALKDDKHMFPPDQMTPFVTRAIAKSHPKVKRLLNALDPYLTNKNFSSMNAKVAFGGKQPAKVAHHFLKHHHLI